MPQICTICRHEKREEINGALLAGEPYRHIASRYGTSTGALQRHKKNDLPATLVKAKQAADEVKAETLFDRLRAINRETQAILEEARHSRNHTIALNAISRVEKQIELEARLLGELDDAVKVAVGINVNSRPANYDLSRLTDKDLEHLDALCKKLAIEPGPIIYDG